MHVRLIGGSNQEEALGLTMREEAALLTYRERERDLLKTTPFDT